MEDLRTELDALTSSMVARILASLHDLKDDDLHRACMDILWDRHGVEGGNWPVSEVDIGPITLEIAGVRTALVPSTTRHQLQAYCRNARPLDPGHRVARRLDWSYIDCDGREREFHHIQCTCGARTDRSGRGVELVMGRHRVGPMRADVWPQAVIPGRNNGHPVFVVCRFSVGTQDPLHAPNTIGCCICGRNLGVEHEWEESPAEDQYLSVQ
jgi:hypothetical protein